MKTLIFQFHEAKGKTKTCDTNADQCNVIYKPDVLSNKSLKAVCACVCVTIFVANQEGSQS